MFSSHEIKIVKNTFSLSSRISRKQKPIISKVYLKRKNRRRSKGVYEITKEISIAFSSTSTNFTCIICLEEIPFAQRHFLHCGHFYHCECIRQWKEVDTQNRNKCPLCHRSQFECPANIMDTESNNLNNPSNSSSDQPEFMIDFPMNDSMNEIISDFILVSLIGLCFLTSLAKIIIFHNI